MPARPANLSGQEVLNILNQNIREIQIRIDKVVKSQPVHKIYKSSGTLNFGSIGANTALERNIKVAGAKQNGAAHASPQLTLGNSNLIWSAYVPSNGLVTIRVLNPTGSPVTPNTVTWNASVSQ